MGCCSDDPPDTQARGASSVTGLGDSSGVSVLTFELILRVLAPSLAVTLFILTPPMRRGLFSPTLQLRTLRLREVTQVEGGQMGLQDGWIPGSLLRPLQGPGGAAQAGAQVAPPCLADHHRVQVVAGADLSPEPALCTPQSSGPRTCLWLGRFAHCPGCSSSPE